MKNIAEAINKVAQSIKGIEKDMKVGDGNYSYKGVSDREVKIQIGRAMQENGLSILPIGVEPTTHINRWEEEATYNGKTTIKQKQQVLTEVVTKYLLLHVSGESIELSGYGHGTDSQDKSAGKATTYALKYTLLYTFLVATGQIDDADNEHSDNIPVPAKKAPPVKKELTPKGPNWAGAIMAIAKGQATIEAAKGKYLLTPANEKLLKEAVQKQIEAIELQPA